MKILMVIDSLDKGGKERRMLELIKGLLLSDEHFEIYLVSLTDRVEYQYVYELPIRFEVLKRKLKKDLTIPFKLKRIITDFKPDIIHSWSTMASVYLSISNLFSGIPLINAVLADAPVHLNLLNKHYFRVKLTAPFTDVYISNSKAGIGSYHTPAHKSVCIYNGIDFTRFENLRSLNEVKDEILDGKPDNAFIVAMVASFDERKDFETLIRAAIKLCTANPSYVFLLMGGGPLLEVLRATVPGKLKESRRIIFTGKRHDIESVLQIIDVGVLMTNPANHGEGVSNSIIEYMASAKPVIATRGGGTDEVVIDQYNGFLIEPQSESALIEKIETLFNNRKLGVTLGENGRKYVLENFELGKKSTEYIVLYRNLISKTG